MKIPDDPFIVELLPEFIDTWISDIKTQFPAILEKKDPDELYRFGHTLKGSCFQFGLDNVAEMGIKLMGYSKEQNWEKTAEMESKINDEFLKVKEFVNNELNNK